LKFGVAQERLDVCPDQALDMITVDVLGRAALALSLTAMGASAAIFLTCSASLTAGGMSGRTLGRWSGHHLSQD
jgi:hypothetical protein